jgi:putative ABC transport system substrate-binding protein
MFFLPFANGSFQTGIIQKRKSIMLKKMNTHSKSQKLTTAVILAIVFALLSSACGGAGPAKVYHIGILSGLDAFTDIADGFKAGMTELGYIEGQNIVYDIKETNVDPAAYESVFQKFVADKVDLIFTFPTEAAQVAKEVTQGTNIPVLFAATFIEGTNIINSVREPGDHITGVRYPGPDFAAKSLEILQEIAPQIKRVLVPYMRNYPSIPGQLEVLHTAATAAGITLIEVSADNAAELQDDLVTRAESADLGLDAILTIYEPLALSPDVIAMLTEFSARHKVIYSFDIFVLWIDNVQSGKLAAPLADKILKGTSAGTIPVVSSEGFLQINYKVAQEKGVTIPKSLLDQANKIIQ